VPTDLLTIGELAARTGTATSALRYYEEIGLLRPTSRVSGHRRYRPVAVDQVGVILVLRDVGFSLDEIRQFVGSSVRIGRAWRELARRKVAELDDIIADATAARSALEHAIRCRHDDIVECPNFSGVIGARLAGAPLEQAHAHLHPT